MNNKLQLCTEMESLDEEIKTFSFGMWFKIEIQNNRHQNLLYINISSYQLCCSFRVLSKALIFVGKGIARLFSPHN